MACIARIRNVQSPDYVTIGNADLIDKRRHREVPIAPGGRWPTMCRFISRRFR